MPGGKAGRQHTADRSLVSSHHSCKAQHRTQVIIHHIHTYLQFNPFSAKPISIICINPQNSWSHFLPCNILKHVRSLLKSLYYTEQFPEPQLLNSPSYPCELWQASDSLRHPLNTEQGIREASRRPAAAWDPAQRSFLIQRENILRSQMDARN